METAPFFKSHNAYFKDKSTETALQKINSMLERSLHYEQYTLADFVNAEAKFNNGDRGGKKVVEYANKLVRLVSGMYLSS